MSILDQVKIGLRAATNTRSGEDIETRLDAMLKSGEMDVLLADNELYKQTVRTTKSFLQVRKTSSELLSFYSMLVRSIGKDDLPPHGDPSRDHILAEFWKKEPILAGAVYSMSAKMTALPWTVVGPKVEAKYYAELLTRASSMEGYDWGGFISASAQDFYTTDRGVKWETPKIGSRLIGKLADLGHIDTLQCAPTGNTKKPMFYLSEVTGQQRYFRPGEFIQFSSLPSARERHLGQGFCASSRAWRAAKLLLGLHDYDEQKLNNLPPEGIASVSGLTMDEFQDAIALWKASREQHQSFTFPQVLWLIGSNPAAQVKTEITGFSQLPESFDRDTVIEQYVNTLALVFGVDAREFWPISTSSMGTAAESEIQHLKAKGKGPGEFVSIVERKLNGEFPEGTEFGFDTQDINEDKQAAEIAKLWIEALLPLVTGGAPGGPKMETNPSPSPASGNGKTESVSAQESPPVSSATGPVEGSGEKIITTQEFLRLLADRGVIPNYLVSDERVVVTDSGISEKEYYEEIYKWRYKEGVLTPERLPTYTIMPYQIDKNGVLTGDIDRTIANAMYDSKTPENGKYPSKTDDLDDVLIRMKQTGDDILEGNRNIRGKPIPGKEALRGSKITQAALKAELDRWRNHPLLAKYVPTVEEGDNSILGKVE
ncbi:hypothetical protein LCGC14_1443530 [marine sediment metagenome]|uniref:Uncharacterized protein n=1 Tax=marine sediment metagenome TaxID=412755 RepID=A0A0F9M0D1_9ZZZZ